MSTETTYDLTQFINAGNNTGAGSGTYEALPEDRYNLEIEEAAHMESQNKPGSFYIATKMTITDGKYKNRKVWNNFSTSPKAMVFIANMFKSSGNAEMLTKSGLTGTALAKAMVGCRFSAMVEPGKTNTGKDTNNFNATTISEVVQVEDGSMPETIPAPKAPTSSAKMASVFD